MHIYPHLMMTKEEKMKGRGEKREKPPRVQCASGIGI
jgi:hypothetical protein